MVFLFNLEPGTVLMKSTAALTAGDGHTDIVATLSPSKELATFFEVL